MEDKRGANVGVDYQIIKYESNRVAFFFAAIISRERSSYVGRQDNPEICHGVIYPVSLLKFAFKMTCATGLCR